MSCRLNLFGFIIFFVTFVPYSVFAADTKVSVYPTEQTSFLPDAAKEIEAVRSVAGNTQFADHTSWSQRRNSTLKDLTDYIPGVYAQPRNGEESSRLSLRGSGLANTFQGRGLLVMQDGVPINMTDGEFEFPVIDPWLIDYATVLPGGNALAEGASTLGGAIDFTTPTGITGKGITLRGEAGSFGTLHSFASVGKTFGDADIFAAASGFSQSGFRDNNEQDISRFNGNIGWRSNDNLSQRVYASHTVSNAEIPGALSKREIAADPSQSNPANLLNHYQRDLDITRIAHKAEWRDGPDSLETTLFYTYRTLDNPVTTYIVEDNNDGGVRVKYTHRDGLDSLTAGVNAGYGTQDESRYRNVNAIKGTHILDRDLDATTSEIYGQYDKNLMGAMYGVASLQGAYSTRNIRQTFPIAEEQDKDYFGYNPRIGLRYDIDPETQGFANISRSFEPPTWAELSGGNATGFNDLDAQTATTGEIGVRRNGGGFNWSAAYYESYLHNEFVNYRFADGSTDTINADKSIHRGIELGLDGDVAENILAPEDALRLRLSYLWSRFHLDGDPLYGDNQLPGMPEHYLRSELVYKNSAGFSFGPNVEWAPKAYPVDLTNTVSADGYAICGARAGWTNKSGQIEAYVEGRNLADKAYTATTNVVPDAAGKDGRYFYPGEGRAIYAGLTLKF